MKILIIMGGFFPGKRYGGPPVSVDNFCSLLNEVECYIITQDHDLAEKEKYAGISEGWNNRGNCKVLYVPNDKYNKSSFERVIKKIKPNILYLQGVFQACILPCLLLALKYNIPTLLAPRGELCSGALKIKKWKKIPYIMLLRMLRLTKPIYWQSTSDEESNGIIKWFKVDENRVRKLDNIPSVPKNVYKRIDKKVGEGRFVFLSRIHPKKNLLNAIMYLKEIDRRDNVIFDIYGPIEDSDYWNICKKEIDSLPTNVIAEYKGTVLHEQVHEVLSQYDAFVFPTLSENYGHVIAESLLVGTPVITSNQTPWNDINEYDAGWAIPLNEPNRFIDAIKTIINENQIEAEIKRKKVTYYINKKNNLVTTKNNYLKVLNEMINENIDR